MPDKAILSVVRVRKDFERKPFEESVYATDPYYLNNCTEEERRENWREEHDSWDGKRGLYGKSGGGWWTPNLQEAQVYGWSRRAKENLARFDSHYVEIVPILLTPSV